VTDSLADHIQELDGVLIVICTHGKSGLEAYGISSLT